VPNVTTFNFHPHLPHYVLTAPESVSVRVLGRQRIDPNRDHPFTAAGNTEFNALIWMPPSGQRAGDILLVDATNFTTHRQPQEFLAQSRHHAMMLRPFCNRNADRDVTVGSMPRIAER